jgi:hypothetical protein
VGLNILDSLIDTHKENWTKQIRSSVQRIGN